MKLLHIDSSILGEKSVSRQLSAAITSHLQAAHAGLEITYYDLNSAPFAYLSGNTGADEQERAQSARALKDFKEADIVVIGAPMYNFTIPAQLKGWIDRVAVAGETFRYTAGGPEGLAGGKRVVIASSRGGVYSGAAAGLDHQEAYLKAVFAFMGIDTLEIIRAEGVNMGAEIAEKAITQAKTAIAALAA